jgi:hypothetical protein
MHLKNISTILDLLAENHSNSLQVYTGLIFASHLAVAVRYLFGRSWTL